MRARVGWRWALSSGAEEHSGKRGCFPDGGTEAAVGTPLLIPTLCSSFLNLLFIEGQLLYNDVLVSAVQQREPAIHVPSLLSLPPVPSTVVFFFLLDFLSVCCYKNSSTWVVSSEFFFPLICWLCCMGSNRDQTHALCTGSAGSDPLDPQGNPVGVLFQLGSDRCV